MQNTWGGMLSLSSGGRTHRPTGARCLQFRAESLAHCHRQCSKQGKGSVLDTKGQRLNTGRRQCLIHGPSAPMRNVADHVANRMAVTCGSGQWAKQLEAVYTGGSAGRPGTCRAGSRRPGRRRRSGGRAPPAPGVSELTAAVGVLYRGCSCKPSLQLQ